ncbi:MAG: hypothetical protein CMN30_22240 [Sandaracinus sp.]|nr:hypothetical protein [Sandaracinus sp.]
MLAACDDSPTDDADVPDATVVDAGAMDGSVDGATSDGGTGDGGTDDGGSDGGTTEPGCVSPTGADPTGTASLTDGTDTAAVTIPDRAACRRVYSLSTTAPLRDDQPDNPRVVTEREGDPTVRSGHDLFDALHALAVEEVRENSVSSIRDGAFDDGLAVDCGPDGCFETGRLWTYVWTRDTSYAVDVGLAPMDPARARGSLEFKLSERRGGGDEQVVQDTGSGGSYPVSTDRVVWALGAWAVLANLEGSERDAFRSRALEALSNTLEHDRRVAFDASDGLYFGEQSFLDWREQTYPEWTADDVVHIAMSKALSTNLLHLRALEVTAALADEEGDTATRDRFGGWADDLRLAIRERFWLESEGQFSTFVTTGLDPAPVRRFDLLGSSLAVIFGVATESQARRVLAGYPHYGPGAPVIWPQQQQTPIYHNRGEWPFVTAYWLRAAKAAGNDAVADRMVRALMRGAALNLSNMENFEAASGAVWQDDGAASGPVVNSQRQLWSVAGYLSMVHHTLFGLEAESDGLHVRPFVTAGLRDDVFAGTDELVLNDYPYRGRRVTVVLHLPESGGTGALTVGEVSLNGTALGGDLLPAAMLEETNRVDVTLTAGATAAASLTEVSGTDWRDVYGPRTPRVTSFTRAGDELTLALDLNGATAADVRWTIYRDGEPVADDLPGTTTLWTDPAFDASSQRSPCYTAELTFAGSGNHSQHAPPNCWWGGGGARVTTIDASAMTHGGGTGSTAHGRFHYEPWGDPGHSLTVPSFTAAQTGTHLLQVTFGNGAGSINTGVTCGIKRVMVEDAVTGAVVAEGPLVMPHLGTWSRWEDSSFVSAELEAGRTYRITIRHDDEMVNMSAFAHFEHYTGGLGGRDGAFSRVNIADLKILAR